MALNDIESARMAQISNEVREVGFDPILVSKINTGTNNSLYRVESSNGDELLGKVYLVDDRNRLDREYGSLSLLDRLGVQHVPKPISARNGIGLYSFESGGRKEPKEITELDIDKIIDFVCILHGISPTNVDEDFQDAIFASFSLEDFLATSSYRMDRFKSYVQSDFSEASIRNLVDSFDIDSIVTDVVSSVKERSPDFSQKIGEGDKRFAHGDFNIQNMLFQDSGDICFIDFEYAGWDDPLKMVSNFIFHVNNSGLSDARRDQFLERYRRNSPLSPQQLQRLDSAILLSSIDSLSVMLWGITPEKLNLRSFSNPDFNVGGFIRGRVDTIAESLSEMQNLE